MSTERRDCPWWYKARTDCAEALSWFWLGMFALLVRVVAMGRTAPPVSPERVATDSLNSDHRTSGFVRLLLTDLRRGSPPPGGRLSTAAGTSRLRALSSFALPLPACSEQLHPVLP